MECILVIKKTEARKVADVEMGDYWIGISLASNSGLIIAARVGKHTDSFLEELMLSTLTTFLSGNGANAPAPLEGALLQWEQ